MKSQNSQFRVGERVYYPALKKYGIVMTLINRNDSQDQRVQGRRYEVMVAGHLRSIPESDLEVTAQN